ncbi:MAG TPA: SH3 domain-containing protein [Mesorhizobium sp.]|jgi:hypothetical protein|nr:SH3 domain-containing protein [Mesorhizobium sp.]
MPKVTNSGSEGPNPRWDGPQPRKFGSRPAKLIGLCFALAFTFAGGVAAAMLTLDPADAEPQAQVAPLQAAQAAPAEPAPAAEPDTPVEPKLAGQPGLPIKKVKTVMVPAVAQARAVPARPASVESTSSVQASATPAAAPPPRSAAAAMDLNRLVAPAKDRWASNLAAVQAGSTAVDEESRTSAAIDQARFAAAAMLPLVAEPMLDAPLAAPDEEAAAPEEEAAAPQEEAAAPEEPQRKTRMARSANLRARPANGGRTLGVLSAGTSIALIGCGKGWCEVSADGRRGFVAERFLKGKSAPAKRRKAARKQKKARAEPAAAPAEAPAAEKLPGVFPEPVIPEPSGR